MAFFIQYINKKSWGSVKKQHKIVYSTNYCWSRNNEFLKIIKNSRQSKKSRVSIQKAAGSKGVKLLLLESVKYSKLNQIY